MGRKSNVRTSYRQDAIIVSRILGAVERDETSEPEWTLVTRSLLERVISQLLTHKPVLKVVKGKKVA